MRFPILTSGVVLLLIAAMCTSSISGKSDGDKEKAKKIEQELSGYSTAYFASGCFWCVEAIYESVKGVEEAVSGYAGGSEKDPSYEQVAAGLTSHAETVKVYYDPSVVSYKTLLKVYYGSQDPTTVNGQHPDYGSQYRSIIFYQNAEEKMIAEDYKKKIAESGKYYEPIATQIIKLDTFYPAEDYHQDFEARNPYQPYVMSVSKPRLKRFQEKYPDLLKENH